ncbi:B-box zinc finger protein [Corallococcus sp. CA053C]|uniref:B-box zinc finger protein n=1 Tax=Corallococcus sp. CA053C TaxID=2316732 RepID=UPI00131568CD|nr:B-box zinc finger protein [Corallococcus sp. CA053C]
MVAPASDRCPSHPTVAAGWRCEQCESLLCPACVETRRMGPVEYFACGHCQGTANVLLRRRSHQDFMERLPGALRFPLTVPGLQTLVAVSLMLAVLRSLAVGIRLFQVLPLTLALGVFWSALFALVRGAARGDADPELPGFTDIVRDTLRPGLRGLAVTVGVFLPASVRALSLLAPSERAVLKLIGAPLEALLSPAALEDPLTWGLALGGFLWLPWAWLLAAAEQPLLSALHPRNALRCIRALGRDAGIVMGVFTLLALLHGGMHQRAEVVLDFGIFFVSRWIAEALTCLVPFAAANLLGLVLYVHGDALGYLPARDVLVPVLGDARPERGPQALREAAPTGPVAATDEAPSTGDDSPAEQLAAFTAAVEARDVARAIALYGILRVLPRMKLSPAHHLFIGQAAAVEGDFPLSVLALEAAADVAPEDPLAPRALVLLARVQGEKMGNAVRAEEIYRYILHRYPDTEAARFAHARVKPAA